MLSKEMVGQLSFCSGCQYPVTQRVLAEVIEELGIANRVVGINSIGCGGRYWQSFSDVNIVQHAHGTAPSVAAGIKRALHGEPIVITTQGDGDCTAIGAGYLINAAARAEKITVIMINNGGYAMTGGQMGTTSLIGQVTTTTPEGRDPSHGFPLHMPELLATIKGVAYAARCALNTPANYLRFKKNTKTAIQIQIDNIGFSFVEVLTACPIMHKMSPVESLAWIDEMMIAEFPLGEFKSVECIS